MTPLIRLVSLVTLPIALLISVSQLLGAEDGPGDGFTAGIITSLALTLAYMIFGYREIHRHLRRMRFEHVLAAGLALAVLAAALPLFTGEPLLASQEASFDIPLVGEITLSRAMLFDIGIYLTVVGGTMTAIDSLEWGIA